MSDSVGTREGWEQWKTERDEGLRDPYGWLSLVELKWLGDVPESLETFPGLWNRDGNTVTFAPVANEPKIYRDGAEITEPLQIEVEPGVSDRSLRDERGREIEVMYRFWGPAIRVRDPQAKRLTEFQGLDRYDFDPTWVLRGVALPYEKSRELTVGSAVEGGEQIVSAWADAEVVLPNGETLILIMTGDGPDSSNVMFFDATNGDTTPGWRSAPVVVDGGTVVIDLNRAQIFPAHLSPYGTCPKPPESNRVQARVEAGEKIFAGRETQ